MSVLKLKPACKEYLWGGSKLISDFNKQFAGETLAETWELSCHPDGPSVISNGEWCNRNLSEYIQENGIEILGKNCRRFQDFPILIKFIDAKDNLSVQVHPDNKYALKNEGQYGKTEMWYVVDCGEEAFLYYGFSKEIDKKEFQERIENNTLLEVLNKVPVQKGDVLFIEAGTIHAIGKDIVIAEIQQNSNITYRVYDYGRRDKENRLRDLHIEKALAVTNRIPIVKKQSVIPHLAKCDYFTVDKVNLDGRMMRKITGSVSEDSFASILVLEGNGTIISGNDIVTFRKGDSLFLPAGSGEFQIEGECEALITTIGEKASPIRIAINMTSRNIQTALVDMNNHILIKKEMKFKKTVNYEEVIQDIAIQVLDLLEKLELKIDNCIGIGAGLPGVIDKLKGKIVYSNNINWRNIPFTEEIQKYIPLPVYINNNANCAALGEMKEGAAKNYHNLVLLTIGNGVGGSVIQNDRIFEGRMAGGNELGHMVIQMNGAKCSCGRNGCLEAYISTPALLQMACNAMDDDTSIMWDMCDHNVEKLTEDIVFEAAKQGDIVAEKVKECYLQYFSVGITNIINVFRPDLILLSGKAFVQNRQLTEDIYQSVRQECFGGNQTGIPEIKVAELGETAGLIGAANLI